MRSEPTIRFATDTDRKGVLDLLNGVFSGQQRSVKLRDDAYWTWKFKSSVYGDSLLTVAEADGRLIGVDHLWPWQFRNDGSVIRAVQPCDAAVDPDFRGMGIFKKMRKHGLAEAGRQGYQLSFNFPNKQSLPGNRAVGATYLGKITWRVRILKPLGVLKSMVLDEKSAAYAIPDTFKLNVDLLHQMNLKREETNRISIDRVEKFFNWRYLDRPKRSYGMIEIGEYAAAIFTVNQKGEAFGKWLLWIL
ncbi:MAG: GNAT family N-acetyltransferase [Bacteroidetes bacterium]|jgi:GNAT superfamily N-acetyltransferase|nr:GNAT family N-acetyltransferase [Bacteroidota bacterium]